MPFRVLLCSDCTFPPSAAILVAQTDTMHEAGTWKPEGYCTPVLFLLSPFSRISYGFAL